MRRLRFLELEALSGGVSSWETNLFPSPASRRRGVMWRGAPSNNEPSFIIAGPPARYSSDVKEECSVIVLCLQGKNAKVSYMRIGLVRIHSQNIHTMFSRIWAICRTLPVLFAHSELQSIQEPVVSFLTRRPHRRRLHLLVLLQIREQLPDSQVWFLHVRRDTDGAVTNDIVDDLCNTDTKRASTSKAID